MVVAPCAAVATATCLCSHCRAAISAVAPGGARAQGSASTTRGAVALDETLAPDAGADRLRAAGAGAFDRRCDGARPRSPRHFVGSRPWFGLLRRHESS